jgi:2-(1,2-epoxy-1,2-dihydrophenyl)acetyl-CoA isomerase
MEYQCLLYNVGDGIATLTLNRPQRLNALGESLREDLYDAIQTAGGDEAVRVIVITGAGRGFCSGGDVKAMNERNAKSASSGGASDAARAASAMEDRIAPLRDRVVLALRDVPKPVIAAVNGPAAGAGMNLALACDIRIAARSAVFGETFAKRGLHVDWGGTYFLPRMIGMQRACEMIFTGETIDAPTAKEYGIVSSVVEDGELMNTVYELAAKIAAGPPIAIRLAKRAMYKSMDSDLRSALEFETYAQNICSQTEDSREGIRAFVEKREPEFTGR